MTAQEKVPGATTAEEKVPGATTAEETVPAATTAEETMPAATTAEETMPAATTAKKKVPAGLTAEEKALASRWALGVVLVGSRLLHLTRLEVVDFMSLQVPDYYRREVRAASGLFQVAAGASMFGPAPPGFARWSNIGLLAPSLLKTVAHVAQPGRARTLGISPVLAWIRLPMQAGLIAWIWRATQRNPSTEKDTTPTPNG